LGQLLGFVVLLSGLLFMCFLVCVSVLLSSMFSLNELVLGFLEGFLRFLDSMFALAGVGLGLLDSVLESSFGFVDLVFVLSHSLSMLAIVFMSTGVSHNSFGFSGLLPQSSLSLNDRRVSLLGCLLDLLLDVFGGLLDGVVSSSEISS